MGGGLFGLDARPETAAIPCDDEPQTKKTKPHKRKTRNRLILSKPLDISSKAFDLAARMTHKLSTLLGVIYLSLSGSLFSW